MTERHILIVDDDPDLLETLRLLLEKEGERRITTVETAAEARHLLASDEELHLVISDLRLGAEPGIELLRESARLRPNTPRILLTGFGDDGIARAGVLTTDAERVYQKDSLIAGRQEFVATVGHLTREDELTPIPVLAQTPTSRDVAEPLTLPAPPDDWWGLVPDPFEATAPAGETQVPPDGWILLFDALENNPRRAPAAAT